MARRLELAADLRVIVDFAVEDDPDRSVFVRERLVPGGEIHDAQPAMAEARMVVDKDARCRQGRDAR